MAILTDFFGANAEERAAKLVAQYPKTVVYVTSILRAREIKLAQAARSEGWKVVLIYAQTTPFNPGRHFDVAIRASTSSQMHEIASALQPRICHVFSGAVDDTIELFCSEKPGAVVADMNDIFVPSLFNYCEERFEPTRYVLENADGFCARDLQAKFAKHLDGYKLPEHLLLFPEYSTLDGPALHGAIPKHDDDEVRVVSVGSFCLETQGMFDSAYLQLARMLTDQKIHFHIYPHWSYRQTITSSFRMNFRRDFADFLKLAQETPYLHIHESLPLDKLALELPQYDFGLISGGSEALGQRLELLTQNYMDCCYSGRIADYIDARLPVLINKEVVYNDWLLTHYGIAHDLGGVLEPGFADKLRDIKHDKLTAANMARAAQTLSLRNNAARLSDFYSEICAERIPNLLHLSPWMRTLKKIAPFRAPIRRFEASVRAQNKKMRDLTTLGRQAIRLDAVQQATIAHQQQSYETLASAAKTIETSALEVLGDLERAGDGSEVDIGKVKSVLTEIISATGSHLQPEAGDHLHSQSLKSLTREMRRIDGATFTLSHDPFGKSVRADDVAGMLNWPEIIDEVERHNSFSSLLAMLEMFKRQRSSFNQYSGAWQLLAAKNLDQLLKFGFENFKRTIGANYFNFFVQQNDPQIKAVEDLLNDEEKELCMAQARAQKPDPKFNLADQTTYWYFVAALWQYLRKIDRLGLTSRISEPELGAPLSMTIDGVNVSQDLSNSLLEYYSMIEAAPMQDIKRVLEIGAGHGRDAHAILTLNPHIQYFIVDIPPTLYISQRYLSSIFRDRKIFPTTDFTDFSAVQDQIEDASIVFLMPHQLVKLPDKYVNHTMSISSFGEMTRSQVARYFEEIDRITNGTFYLKQWKKSINPFDKLEFEEDEYPINPNWVERYRRPCAVQSEFFESLYTIGK